MLSDLVACMYLPLSKHQSINASAQSVQNQTDSQRHKTIQALLTSRPVPFILFVCS